MDKKFSIWIFLFLSYSFGNWNDAKNVNTFIHPLSSLKNHTRFPGGGTGVNFCWVCAAGLSEPLQSILWPIIEPILVTFGQICIFHDPNLVTFYFYELTHFLDGMKNTLLFVTNILVHLLTVNMKNCLTPQNHKMCDPIIVNPVVTMWPHPAAHPH